MGAIDGSPRQKQGWNPLLPAKSRSFYLEVYRNNFLGNPCPNGSARLGDTPSLPYVRQLPPYSLVSNSIEVFLEGQLT